MKLPGRLVCTTFILLSSLSVNAQDFSIANGVFGNVGGTVSGNGLRLVSTAGQPLVGIVSNGGYALLSGVGHVVPGIRWTDVAAEIEQLSNVPRSFRLDQNFPNPFNPSTTIRFAIPRQKTVTLALYNILGQRVKTLIDGDLQPGEYQVELLITDHPSGLYLYRFQAGVFTETRKLLLLK